ncbi:hypothetical protein Pst134EB_001550 [Puccinia striiformis f. sp. tritici]|nr:hypothetical protein Pst134EB_001550 [Puccinia striiformis f. sp. tritici]
MPFPNPSDPTPQKTEGSIAPPLKSHKSSEEIVDTDQPAPKKICLDLNVALGLDGEPSEEIPSVSSISNFSNAKLSSSDVEQQVQDSIASSDVPRTQVHPIQIPEGSKSQEPMASQQQNWSSERFSTVELDEPSLTLSDLYRFPKYGADSTTAAYFLSQFEGRIRECDAKLRLEKTVGRNYEEDLGVIFIRLLTSEKKFETVSNIRVGKGPKTVTGKISSFKSLTRWILYAHMSLMKYYKIGPDEQRVRHTDLFSWLIAEVFEHTNCPPILGRFPGKSSDYDLTKYRPIQRRLIKYLGHDRYIYHVYPVSLAAVGIWYKTFHHEFWNSNFKSDEEYWELLESLMNEGPPGKDTLQRWQHLKPTLPHKEKLDDFQIIELATLIPADEKEMLLYIWRTGGLKPPIPAEQRILQRAKEIYQGFPGAGKTNRKVICDTLPVAVNSATRIDESGSYRYAYALRLTQPGDLNLPWLSLEHRFSMLLRTTNHLYSQLYQSLPVENLEDMKSSYERFLNWFSDEFFKPKDSLPVIGTEEFRVDAEPVGNRLDFGKLFGDLQSYLIKNLSVELKTLELFQASVTILGYWFFKKNPAFWERHFGTEANYFDSLARLITA